MPETKRSSDRPLNAMSTMIAAIMTALASVAAFNVTTVAEGAEPPPIEEKTKLKDGIQVPEWWPDEQSLPREKSNCVKCHVTAGRELSLAVADFTHSIHDKKKLSCYDCHGGNTENDDLAHDEEFEFIGTKLSTHLAKCAKCHEDQAAVLAKGLHAWDFSKRINTNFPMCIDCHGNHDVSNPTSDFKLMNVCLDCHEDMATKYKTYTSIVKENDLLWASLQKVRMLDIEAPNPMPRPFRRRLTQLSKKTMKFIHRLPKISGPQAQELLEKSASIRAELDKWFKDAN